METTSGMLWALQVIVGPLVLGIALAYATFRYRRRRRLGETHSTREIITLAVPVIIAVALLTILMMIPGSQ
jgi:predicted PurR-regulated permease PerM